MDGERFYEIRARFSTLEGALEWAHTLDANGVAEVVVDNGEGYGVRGCVAQGCDSILTYPDEGSTCYDHS
jgi:hypothetical protein